MLKIFKDFYKFLSGLVTLSSIFLIIPSILGYFAVSTFRENLKDFYWVPWSLLVAVIFFVYLLIVKGNLSFYPQPEFADDFRTVSQSFQDFMSDSNFYSNISKMNNFGKISQRNIDAIYKLSEQIESNPIKIRNRRLRSSYRKFQFSLEDLVNFLESNYSIDDMWSVIDTEGLSELEIKKIRVNCAKKMSRLSNSYSELFSQISHLGGTTFQVISIY